MARRRAEIGTRVVVRPRVARVATREVCACIAVSRPRCGERRRVGAPAAWSAGACHPRSPWEHLRNLLKYQRHHSGSIASPGVSIGAPRSRLATSEPRARWAPRLRSPNRPTCEARSRPTALIPH